MKTRPISALALVLCLILTLVSSLHAETVSVTHLKGTVDVPKNPKRIVVLDYAALDTIQTLGIEAEIALSKQTLPGYLSRYKDARYLDLGSLKEFNLESVSSFKPEAIFISMRQANYYDELAKIAPVIIAESTSSDSADQIKKNIHIVANVFGKEQECTDKIAAIDAQIASIKEKASSSGKKALFILANDGKVSAYGKGSRFGMVYGLLGFEQAGEPIEVSTHGKRVNYEYIALANPDIIFVLDRAAAIGRGATLENFSTNPLISRTNAARNGGIVALDSQVWYLVGGGLTAFKGMLTEVEKAL